MGLLKQVGWKIAIVSIFVFIGTFVGSAVITHLILKLQGLICPWSQGGAPFGPFDIVTTQDGFGSKINCKEDLKDA